MQQPKTTTLFTTASQIRVNLDAYHEAASDAGYLSHKLATSHARMRRAVENLRSLGAHDEAEKLHVPS